MRQENQERSVDTEYTNTRQNREMARLSWLEGRIGQPKKTIEKGMTNSYIMPRDKFKLKT